MYSHFVRFLSSFNSVNTIVILLFAAILMLNNNNCVHPIGVQIAECQITATWKWTICKESLKCNVCQFQMTKQTPPTTKIQQQQQLPQTLRSNWIKILSNIRHLKYRPRWQGPIFMVLNILLRALYIVVNMKIDNLVKESHWINVERRLHSQAVTSSGWAT